MRRDGRIYLREIGGQGLFRRIHAVRRQRLANALDKIVNGIRRPHRTQRYVAGRIYRLRHPFYVGPARDPMSVAYPNWSRTELEKRRDEAIARFIKAFRANVPSQYRAVLTTCRNELDALMDATDYLRAITAKSTFFDRQRVRDLKTLEGAARYCCSPALSHDTLKVLGAATSKTEVLSSFLDRGRFPWLARQGSQPSPGELDLSCDITSRLMTEARLATELRKAASQRQERAVAAALTAAGYKPVEPAEVKARMRARPNYRPRKGMMPHNYTHALNPGSSPARFL